MVETVGDFIAESLPASTFLGLLWVVPLSCSWRSQVLGPGSQACEPQGPQQV